MLKEDGSCSRCRLRKVKCSKDRPACKACLRTSKYKSRDLSECVCCYDGIGLCSEDKRADQSNRTIKRVGFKRGSYKKKNKPIVGEIPRSDSSSSNTSASNSTSSLTSTSTNSFRNFKFPETSTSTSTSIPTTTTTMSTSPTFTDTYTSNTSGESSSSSSSFSNSNSSSNNSKCNSPLLLKIPPLHSEFHYYPSSHSTSDHYSNNNNSNNTLNSSSLQQTLLSPFDYPSLFSPAILQTQTPGSNGINSYSNLFNSNNSLPFYSSNVRSEITIGSLIASIPTSTTSTSIKIKLEEEEEGEGAGGKVENQINLFQRRLGKNYLIPIIEIPPIPRILREENDPSGNGEEICFY